MPASTTGRCWLLRVGLYQLQHPQEIADDWIWITDHTVQIGQEKCLAVLGVRLGELPAPGNCLRLEDLALLSLHVVTHSDRQIVQQQLEDTKSKTGVPLAILSDQGSDLKSGINRFCDAHPETCSLYDVAHKAASLLKALLAKDEDWKSFCTQVGQTKFQTQQTEWAFLVPPSGRSKARYMNLGHLLRWARETLYVLDHPSEALLRFATQERLEEKFGWLRSYRELVSQWSEYEVLLDHTVDQIRRYGYGSEAAYQVALRLGPHVRSESGQQLKDQLLRFVRDQSASVRSVDRLPGSSEILESAFGKLKSLAGDQQKGGMTSMLLGLGAIVGKIDRETIHEALVATPWKQVRKWIEDNLGTTFQAKRRLAYQQAASATKPA